MSGAHLQCDDDILAGLGGCSRAPRLRHWVEGGRQGEYVILALEIEHADLRTPDIHIHMDARSMAEGFSTRRSIRGFDLLKLASFKSSGVMKAQGLEEQVSHSFIGRCSHCRIEDRMAMQADSHGFTGQQEGTSALLGVKLARSMSV